MRGVARRGRRAVATAAIVVVLLGCGTSPSADGPVADPAGTEGEEAADVADAPASAASEATAAFTAIVAALKGRDLDALVSRSVGPAAAFFGYLRHFQGARADPDDPFENLVVEPDRPQVTVEGDVARVGATIGYGSQEGAPPRVLTDLELRLVDGRWYLAGFVRNGSPIADWVTPAPAEATVSAGGIDVEVVGLFVDVGCFDGTDVRCPAAHRDSAALAFVVVNGTGGDIRPVPVPASGGDAIAVLDAGGSEWPLVSAEVQGFPREVPSPAVGVFQGASRLGAGGDVRLAWETEDGTVHAFELPVPAYPHGWAADGW
jgi:hypothetical protein